MSLREGQRFVQGKSWLDLSGFFCILQLLDYQNLPISLHRSIAPNVLFYPVIACFPPILNDAFTSDKCGIYDR